MSGEGEFPVLLDEFELGEEIGRGGFGVVLRGRRRSDGAAVAIKLPLQDAMLAEAERIQRESQLLSRLRHPNLAGFHGCFRHEGERLALVYELLEGRPLNQVQREGLPARGDALAWIDGLAAGLDALHGAGVIHRDVKAENAFVLADGTVKLLDFGLARPVAPGATLTATGMVTGTPATMAPELFRGERATAASDLYALGCIAYELLTGYSPVPGDLQAILEAHKGRGPVPLCEADPSLPRALGRAFEGILHREPGRRPASGAALAAAVRGGLESKGDHSAATVVVPGGQAPGTVVVGSAPAAAPAPKPRRNLGPLVMLVGVGLLAGVFWPRGGARDPVAPEGSRDELRELPGQLEDLLREASRFRMSRRNELVREGDEGYADGYEAIRDPHGWGLFRDVPAAAPLDRPGEAVRSGGLPPDLTERFAEVGAAWKKARAPDPFHPELRARPSPGAVEYRCPDYFLKEHPWYRPPSKVSGWLRAAVEATGRAAEQIGRVDREYQEFRRSPSAAGKFPLGGYGGQAVFYGVTNHNLGPFTKVTQKDLPSRRQLARLLLPAAEEAHTAMYCYGRAVEAGEAPGHVGLLGYLAIGQWTTLIRGSYLAALSPDRLLGPAASPKGPDRRLLEFFLWEMGLRVEVLDPAEYEDQRNRALIALRVAIEAHGNGGPFPGYQFVEIRFRRQLLAAGGLGEEIGVLFRSLGAPKAWVKTEPGMLPFVAARWRQLDLTREEWEAVRAELVAGKQSGAFEGLTGKYSLQHHIDEVDTALATLE